MRVLREGVGKTMVYLRGVPNVAIARAGLGGRARIQPDRRAARMSGADEWQG